MKDKKILIPSIIFIGIGIYYLAVEFISIIYSDSFINAYVGRTISEIANPYSTYSSPLHYLMNSAFIITGPLFLLCYVLIFKDKNIKYLPIGITLSVILALGSILTGIFHDSIPNSISIHTIGSIMVFTSGNLLLLYTAIYYNEHKGYNTIVLILGLVGLLSGIGVGLSLMLNFYTLLPILERMTVYPIIIFEIITGIHFLMKKNEYIATNSI